MSAPFTEGEVAAAERMLAAVRAVFDGEDADIVEAVLIGALLSFALSQPSKQAAEEMVQVIGGEALEEIENLWTEREIIRAGGVN